MFVVRVFDARHSIKGCPFDVSAQGFDAVPSLLNEYPGGEPPIGSLALVAYGVNLKASGTAATQTNTKEVNPNIQWVAVLADPV